MLNWWKKESEKLEKDTETNLHFDLQRATLKKIPNRKFTSIHDILLLQLCKCLEEAIILEWMTKGKTTPIQLDPQKETIPSNYRLITYLPMIWKILTVRKEKKINYSLVCRKLFRKNKKYKHRGSSPWKVLWTFLKLDKGETQTHRPNDKKIENYAQGLTPERWKGQTIWNKKRRRKN